MCRWSVANEMEEVKIVEGEEGYGQLRRSIVSLLWKSSARLFREGIRHAGNMQAYVLCLVKQTAVW